MPDSFNENMMRYRQRERASVGGLYSEQSAVVHGWSPGPSCIVQVDAWARMSSNFPTALDIITTGTGHTTTITRSASGTQFQGILRLEKPLTNLAGVYIPASLTIIFFFNPSDGQGVVLQIIPIFVDLHGGAFDLATMDWNKGYYNTNGDHGTLFDTAENFHPTPGTILHTAVGGDAGQVINPGAVAKTVIGYNFVLSTAQGTIPGPVTGFFVGYQQSQDANLTSAEFFLTAVPTTSGDFVRAFAVGQNEFQTGEI